MKLRVLMLGPGEGVMGGITTFVQVLTPVLEQYVDLLYLITVRDRLLRDSGRISIHNILLVVSQYVRFLVALFRFRPQIVHVHTSLGIAWLKDTFFILVSKLFGHQVFLHMHGGNFPEIYKKSNPYIQRYTRKILDLADVIIVLSAEYRNFLGGIVPGKRIELLKNCIGVFTGSRQIQDQNTGAPIALFLGVVGPSKGVFDLLEAMSRLKSKSCSLKLWIAGYEERNGDLAHAQNLIQILGLENVCQYIGTVIGAEKLQVLQEASMLVLPSYMEAMPMSILEAMAARLPVIATPVGGIPDLVRDGYNGFLVPPGDISALVLKLETLVRDQVLRETMGRRGQEIVNKEFGVEHYVKRLLALYELRMEEAGN